MVAEQNPEQVEGFRAPNRCHCPELPGHRIDRRIFSSPDTHQGATTALRRLWVGTAAGYTTQSGAGHASVCPAASLTPRLKPAAACLPSVAHRCRRNLRIVDGPATSTSSSNFRLGASRAAKAKSRLRASSAVGHLSGDFPFSQRCATTHTPHQTEPRAVSFARFSLAAFICVDRPQAPHRRHRDDPIVPVAAE